MRLAPLGLGPGLALASLLAPAAAEAATVAHGCALKHCADGVFVVAEPGEVNRIRVVGSSRGVVVTDSGAPLRAAEGCTAAADGSVSCPGIYAVLVRAGDGDDAVELATEAGMEADVNGGAGDDVLAGGPSGDQLYGGGGRDRLLGGAGCDLLSDGDRRAAPDADVLDGGEGCDVVDYSSRREPVTVRVDARGDAAAAGQAGEGDVLTAVDGAFGGSGDDVLHASDAGAVSPLDEPGGLVGGRGDDVLVGGAGRDEIDAGEGRDRVRAGGGDDDVSLSFAEDAARADCGDGFDYVTFTGPRDVLRGCDSVEAADVLGVTFPVPLARGVLRVERPEERVRISVRVDRGALAGRMVAHRSFPARSGRLRLTRLGRRLARRGARPPLRVVVRAGRLRTGYRIAGGSP